MNKVFWLNVCFGILILALKTFDVIDSETHRNLTQYFILLFGISWGWIQCKKHYKIKDKEKL